MSRRDSDSTSAAGDREPEPRGDSGPPEDDERPLADRRSGGQGARPSPDEEIAGEREPSPTDPASYDPDQEDHNEPPEYPTRA